MYLGWYNLEQRDMRSFSTIRTELCEQYLEQGDMTVVILAH